MANVLNEFLSGVSKGFADAAFASYSRRKAIVRSDIDRQFTTLEDTLEEGEVSQDYLSPQPETPEGQPETGAEGEVLEVVDDELEEL